jgi:flagellar hook assembly protein FlgD
VAGQRVRKLCSSKFAAGSHTVRWDGKTDQGMQAASGIYFYRLRAASWQDVKKMTVIR